MLERDRERSPRRSECRTGEAALQAGAQSGHCVQAARSNSVANALVAQLVGEGHTKIDGPAPMQPSDSPPAVKDQTSAPHASTLPAQTTSVYGRHQSVLYIEENTRSQADTGY